MTRETAAILIAYGLPLLIVGGFVLLCRWTEPKPPEGR